MSAMTSKQRVEQFVTLNNTDCTTAGINKFQTQTQDNIQQIRLCYRNAKEVMSRILEGETKNLRPATPFNVRQAIIAQYNGRVGTKPNSPTDGDGVVMKNFLSASTIGAAFSIAARIIRVVVSTAFLIFSLMIAAYQQSTYGKKMPARDKYSLVEETLRRYCYEWADLAISLGITCVGLINTVGHNNIPLDTLRDYYFDRIDRMNRKDEILETAKQVYDQVKKDERAARKTPIVATT